MSSGTAGGAMSSFSMVLATLKALMVTPPPETDANMLVGADGGAESCGDVGVDWDLQCERVNEDLGSEDDRARRNRDGDE